MTELTIEEALSQQYDVLGHGLVDGYTEIRTFNPSKSYICQDKESFINTVKELEGDIYVGINPRKNNVGTGLHGGFCANDISYLTTLVVDIDPIRPKDAPSTDKQHNDAIALSQKLRDGFNRGYVVDSGSGSHLYLPLAPIKIENLSGLTKSLKLWMDTQREAHGTKELKIDAIFDLPRVIRIWGSHNHRSNRPCKPLRNISSVDRWNYSFQQQPVSKQSVPETASDITNERFNQLVKLHKRLGEIVEGNISYPSRSEADFEFILILSKAHFSLEEIKELVLKNPHGRKEECKESDIIRIMDKCKDDPKSNSYSLRNTSDHYFDGLESRSMGIRTGISALDELTSGLKGGKIYIYAARPNVGKTSLITQVLLNIAEQGKTCLYYPTEVGSDPIFDKIISQRTHVNLKKFQNGSFTEADKGLIKAVRPSLSNLPLIVVEDFGVMPSKIEEGAKLYAPDVIAIDFFQALKWDDPNQVGEKNEAVRRIKQIAIDLNIPIIIASQLNRGDGKLDLKQLKGAGALEELGDVIAYLNAKSNGTEYPVPYELSVMKSKYSATGLVDLFFYRSISLFTEVNYGPKHSAIGKAVAVSGNPTTPANNSSEETF